MAFLSFKPSFYFVIFVSLLSAGVAGQAQETDSPDVPPPPGMGETGPLPVPDETGPTIPDLPEVPPVWDWQRTTDNPSRDVRNTHQRLASDDGSQQLRQHLVENPRGEMVQTWERSQTEDGYLYRRAQTFTAPDGTLLRQHEKSLSGTDPYNYTRQHEMTLRDGRTILHSQTRSWDGTTGAMERTFIGPNGQTREFQRAWTPDDLASGEPRVAPTPTSTLSRVDGIETVSRTLGQPTEKRRWGWVGKLNPFREGGFFRPARTASLASSTSPGRSGFTLGSGGRSRMGRVPPGLSRKLPGEPSPKSSRPPWAGPSSSASPPHRTGMAFPANPGQARKH